MHTLDGCLEEKIELHINTGARIFVAMYFEGIHLRGNYTFDFPSQTCSIKP